MASEEQKPSVEYNFLSNNCGVKVSNLTLGTMTFGEMKAFPIPGNCDEAGSHKIMDRYAELGGNFIDTANVYASGESERYIGSWLSKQNRDKYVIATKTRFETDSSDPNGIGLSRKHIVKNLEDSLERLKTPFVDLYQIHCWDAATPIAETLQTLNDLVRCGKVRYVGGSNLTGWQLQKIVDLNRQNGFPQFVSLQQQYSLLIRGIELELFDVCKNEGIGVLPWSPLKGGLLTNKVNRETRKAEQGSRVSAAQSDPAVDTLLTASKFIDTDDYWNILDTCDNIGKKYKKSIAQVALRWAAQRKPVSSVIIGAKTVKQLEENMAAGAGWCLTEEEMEQLNTASSLKSFYPYDVIGMANGDRYHAGCVTGSL